MATTAFLEKAYLAYFGRPVDLAGLAAYGPTTTATNQHVLQDFSSSPESIALYGPTFGAAQVNAIYQMLFNRDAEPAGLTYWLTVVGRGDYSPAGAAFAILQGAQNADATAVANKLLASAAFSQAVDTTAEILGYTGDAAAAAARAFLHGVTTTVPTPTEVAAAVAATAAVGGVIGETFTLTTGIDNIVGTSGNDTINATVTATSAVLGGLDKVDGGAGTDTLNIADSATNGTDAFTLPAGFSVSNVEALSISTNGAIGGATAFDVSGITGLTSATFVAAGVSTNGANVKAADTTNVNVTVSGANTAIVDGGKAVSVTGGTGATTVSGKALTEVTITKGGAATINNADGATVKNTLTSVTLNSVDADSTVTSDGLTTLTLKGATAGTNLTTLTNTKAHALTLNVDGSGYDTAGTAQVQKVADATATTITVNATGAKSNVELNGSTGLTKIVATGSAALKVDVDGTGTNTAVTAFDGSAATGGQTLVDLAVKTVTVSTGAGNDVFTTAQTDKVTFTTNAGNDKVTVATALAAGSNINLGAGDDSLLFATGGSIANSTATATTVIDGGEGSDTLALALVGSANVGVFKNFEVFDVVGQTTDLDLTILAANNTVTGLVGSGALGQTGVDLLNVGAGVGFTATGDMGTKVLSLTQATAGSLSIGINVDETTANTAANTAEARVTAVNATSITTTFDNANLDKLADYANAATLTVVAEKATSLNVVSGGSEVKNTLNFTQGDSATTKGNLTSATITGTQALTLDVAGGTTVELATVDASGQTAGGLTFNLNDLKGTGTIKLGAGDDVLTAMAVNATTVSTSATLAVQTVEGLQKGSAEDLTAVKGFDVIKLGTSAQAADVAATATHTVKDGVFTFNGAGVGTLDAAVAAIAGVLGANEAVVFNFAGTNYLYAEGADGIGGDEALIKLTGVTDIKGLDNVAAGDLYVF